MSLLIISLCVGILASGLLWMDHTMFQTQDSTDIQKGSLIKIFLLGFLSSYLGGSIISGDDVLPEALSDSLKTGRPSF